MADLASGPRSSRTASSASRCRSASTAATAPPWSWETHPRPDRGAPLVRLPHRHLHLLGGEPRLEPRLHRHAVLLHVLATAGEDLGEGLGAEIQRAGDLQSHPWVLLQLRLDVLVGEA